MLRLLLLFLLILLVLWAAKGVLNDLGRLLGPRRSEKADSPLADELVKDPVCGVYCPKKTAYKLKHQGHIYYFCSPQCREKFIEQSEVS